MDKSITLLLSIYNHFIKNITNKSYISINKNYSSRSADITDIILNIIGALLGRFVFCYLNIIFNAFFNNMHIKYLNNNNNKVKVFTVVQVISCLIFLVASQS